MAALLSATTKLCGRFGQVAPVAAAVLTRTATLSASSSLLSVYGRRWVSSIPTAPELEVALEPLEKPDHHIFHLTFNRPAARNAIGKKFLAELRSPPVATH
jgi:hypothetical protein